MPSKGNLRLAASGIWEVWDSQDWVFLTEYYPASPRGGVSVYEQRKAISDLQHALNALDVTEVTGTNPQNYQFTMGPGADILPEFGIEDEAGFVPGLEVDRVLSLRQLHQEASNRFNQGVVRHQKYKDLEALFKERGFGPGTNRPFEIPVPRLDENDEYILKPDGTRETMLQFQDDVYEAALDAVAAQQGLMGEVNYTHETSWGQKMEVVNGQLFKGPMPEDKPPLGERKTETVKHPDTNEVLSIRITEPDGSYRYIKPGTPAAQKHVIDVRAAGENVSPDLMRAAAAVSGRPGVSGQPARRQVTDEIIENIVPGYHGVQVKPGEWELVKAPSPAEGPTPGELEYGKPFPIGDGRFAIKTGEDDYEIVTPAGGQWFVDAWGNGYIQDASGALNPVDAPTIDEQINQSLVEGNAAKAMALSDFRDRPSAEERFRLAMEFARSPGDLMTISAIVRGLIEPPAPIDGQVTRVAAPPDWVVDAWDDLTSAWGIPDELKTVLPGVTKEAAAATGIGKGNLVDVGYAQDQSNEGDQDIIGDLTRPRGPANFAEAFPEFEDTLNQAYLGFDQKREIQEAVMRDADINMGTSFRDTVQEPSAEAKARQEAALAADPFRDLLDKPATPGAEFATPYAAALAAQDAAPVTSAAAQDRARLGGRDWDEILDDLLAEYGEFGFTREEFDEHLQRLARESNDPNSPWYFPTTGKDRIDRFKEIANLLASRYQGLRDQQKQDVVTDLGPDYPTDSTGRPLDPNVVFGMGLDKDPTFAGYGGATAPSELGPAWSSVPAMRAALPETKWEQPGDWRPGGAPREPTPEEVRAQEAAAVAQRAAVAADLARQRDPATLADEPFPAPAAVPITPARPTGPPPGTYVAPAAYWGEEDDPYSQSDIRASLSPAGQAAVSASMADYRADREAEAEARATLEGTSWAQPATPYDPYDDFFADGGPVFRDAMAIVGEQGPELVRLPEGAEVIPADFTQAMLQGRRPRRMQYGGKVQIGGEGGRLVQESDLEALRGGAVLDQDVSSFDFQPDQQGPVQFTERRLEPAEPKPSPYPAGVQQVMAGRPIEQPRSLFRPAGLRVPSAQAMRNLVPEEMEAYRELGTLAGIPKGAYEREFRQAMPGGQARVRRPRFQARRQRRL